jgi:hypothetical protein
LAEIYRARVGHGFAGRPGGHLRRSGNAVKSEGGRVIWRQSVARDACVFDGIAGKGIGPAQRIPREGRTGRQVVARGCPAIPEALDGKGAGVCRVRV